MHRCKDNYYSQLNFSNYTNCYNSCSNYLYYDTNINTYHCTESLKCPSNYNKLIIDKNKCVEDCKLDEKYKYEYLNECYIKCPNKTLNNSFNCEPWDNQIIINVQNYFNISIEKKEINEIIFYEKEIGGIFITFSSIKYLQQINDTKRITIDLGKCEDILKQKYNISDSNSLYILILIIEQEGMKIPKVE